MRNYPMFFHFIFIFWQCPKDIEQIKAERKRGRFERRKQILIEREIIKSIDKNLKYIFGSINRSKKTFRFTS